MTAHSTPVLRRAGVTITHPGELRLGAIDVGSNSLHMVIAQAGASGGLTTLWRVKEMVGLGRMSFPSHHLSHEIMDRGLVTLRRLVEEARRRQCEHVLAVATSAVREAENGGEFIARVRQELGLHVRVVSAREEARLIFLGVRQTMEPESGMTLMIDIGGGSVEFIVADTQKPVLLESRKLGAARMTARFINSDPVQNTELEALRSHYDAELTPLIDDIRKLAPQRAIATSGTFENLAAMCGSEIPGQTPPILRQDDLRHLLDRLLQSRSKDRAKMQGLDSQRKDQIIAGALLAWEIMTRLDIKQITLCRSALREGILVDYLARRRPELQSRGDIKDQRRRAVLDMGRRYHWPREHSEQVARLTVRMFDELQAFHRMGPPERELIEYGAMLHDIGALIGQSGHHKHSLYLILNGELESFTREEVRIIANIARYHRKATPSPEHPEFASLPEPAQKIVRIGAAILRVCDGLDRTSGAVITDLHCRIKKGRIDIQLISSSDCELEVWSARERSNLLAEVSGRTVSFDLKPAEEA